MSRFTRSPLVWITLAILFTFAYYYFFTERLPWFWYDDIERLDNARLMTTGDLVSRVFDFTTKQFGTERPVQQLFIKLCSTLFGEDPHAHRLAKVALFCVALLVLYILQVKNEVPPVAAAAGIVLAATLPSTMLGTAWVGDSASIELLFLICALALFRYLCVRYDGRNLPWSIGIASILLPLVVSANESKAPAKIIPLLFLSYLAVSGTRRIFLYVTAGLSLLAVIPYGSLGESGMGKAYINRYHWELLVLFIRQGWILIISGVAVILLTRRWELLRSRHLRFLLFWVVWEMLFFVFYPSAEVRYLYTSSFAVVTFLTALVSLSIEASPKGTRKNAAIAVSCIAAVVLLSMNTIWNDSFRGSVGGHLVIVDKKMRYINEQYKNAFAFYNKFTPDYYARDTTNLYVNVNERYRSFDHLIVRTPGSGISIVNPQQYSSIIALDESIVPLGASMPLKVFDSVIEGSLWDRFHRSLGTDSFHLVSLYNFSLGSRVKYPPTSGIYQITMPQ